MESRGVKAPFMFFWNHFFINHISFNEGNFFFIVLFLGDSIEDPLCKAADEFIEEKKLRGQKKIDIQEFTSDLKRGGVQDLECVKSLTPECIKFITGPDTVTPLSLEFLEKLHIGRLVNFCFEK